MSLITQRIKARKWVLFRLLLSPFHGMNGHAKKENHDRLFLPPLQSIARANAADWRERRQSSGPQPAGAPADSQLGPALPSRGPSAARASAARASAAPDCDPSPRSAGRAISLALRCRETPASQTSATEPIFVHLDSLRFDCPPGRSCRMVASHSDAAASERLPAVESARISLSEP